MKHIHNLRPLALAFILVVTGIAAAMCGLVMKGQLQKYVGGYDDKWAVAVPFLMSVPTIWPRLALISPITSPMYSSGAVTTTFIIGSSSVGPAFRHASLKAMLPQILNAISEESTSW